MAVSKSLVKTSLRFYVENGTNEDGTPKYSSKTYSKINPAVTNDAAKTFLQNVASLQTKTVPTTMSDGREPYEAVDTMSLNGTISE